MKILFLSDNFYPEVNAPATRTYEHCKEWVKNGVDVTVITGAPNFPKGKVFEGYKNSLYKQEIIDGIKVIRVWTYIAENKGTIKRILDFISFAVSAFIVGLFQKCDLIIGTTPQFFTALSARKLSKWKRKPWVMEVRDIWPESIKAVGAIKNQRILRYFEKKEIQCYNSADKIIAVSKGIKARICNKGIPENKLAVYTNASNLEHFTPRSPSKEFCDKYDLEGKKVIAYLGTMGMAHKLDFILQSAKKIDDPNIMIIIIGEGAEKENLKKIKDELGLMNVMILDGISKEQVPEFLSLIDIALVNLKRTDLFLDVIPSKIFENAAMGKPILLGLQGETKDIIEKYKAGLAFIPEDENDFLEKLELLAKNEEVYTQCVEGCYKLAKDYNRKKIAGDMLETISSLKD